MTTLYVALPDALLIVRGEGEAWRDERALEGTEPQCLAADPLHPERVLCGTFGQGVWRSDDAGRSWREASAGITAPQVMAVAVSRAERAGDRGILYAGTEPTALYRSEDAGGTWHECEALRELPSAPTWSFPPRPWTSHVRAIAPDPSYGGRLFVAVEAGALVRSRDAGQSWSDRVEGGPFDSHTLATPPQLPGVIYSAAGDGFMQPGMGFCESHDGGETWSRPGEGLGYHYLWGLAVDPADPTALIVSCAPGPREAHTPSAAESAIYRRVGGGAFQRCKDGLPSNEGMLASSLAAHEAEPGVFYAANNTGVYRSADAGASWRRMEIAWPEAYRAQHVRALLVTD
jgi:photosystem II stability/assembly factor-like uncharacterized protein